MNNEKDIEEMIEVLKNKHFEKKPHEYIADMPRSICSALVEAGYRKADEVRKETAKHIKWSIINNLPFDDDAYEIIDEIFAEYGVEVDE